MAGNLREWVCVICGEPNPAQNRQCSCGATRPNDDTSQASNAQAGPPPMKRSRFDEGALVNQNVTVQGLNNKPELNGLSGAVTEYDPAANRYTVEIAGRGNFRLKPENLVAASPPVAAPPANMGEGSAAPISFPAAISVLGRMVEVQGLVNKPALNGTRGILKDFSIDTGRYLVETIQGPPEMFKLKPENLRDLNTPGFPSIAVLVASHRPPQAEPQAPVAQNFNDLVIKHIDVAVTYKGRLIGTGGENIKRIREESGAFVEIEKERSGAADAAVVAIKGTSSQVEAAERLVRECVSEAKEMILKKVAQAAKYLDLGGEKKEWVDWTKVDWSKTDSQDATAPKKKEWVDWTKIDWSKTENEEATAPKKKEWVDWTKIDWSKAENEEATAPKKKEWVDWTKIDWSKTENQEATAPKKKEWVDWTKIDWNKPENQEDNGGAWTSRDNNATWNSGKKNETAWEDTRKSDDKWRNQREDDSSTSNGKRDYRDSTFDGVWKDFGNDTPSWNKQSSDDTKWKSDGAHSSNANGWQDMGASRSAQSASANGWQDNWGRSTPGDDSKWNSNNSYDSTAWQSRNEEGNATGAKWRSDSSSFW